MKPILKLTLYALASVTVFLYAVYIFGQWIIVYPIIQIMLSLLITIIVAYGVLCLTMLPVMAVGRIRMRIEFDTHTGGMWIGTQFNSSTNGTELRICLIPMLILTANYRKVQ